MALNDNYFVLTPENIYKLDLETKKWLARMAIILFKVKDEQKIKTIENWYQIPEEEQKCK